jgi:hypothetical protein
MPVSSSWMQIALARRTRLAVVVVDDGVQVADLAQAVAAPPQRVGQHAQPGLALVEHGLDPVHRCRIPVRYPHLRQRGPVQDRAFPASVQVAHPVQHQPLAGGVADDQVPLLPADLVPVEHEARAVRLGDLDGPYIASEVGQHREVRGVRRQLGSVVARARRQRHIPVVVDGQDRRGVEIDRGDDILHRAGERVVGR